MTRYSVYVPNLAGLVAFLRDRYLTPGCGVEVRGRGGYAVEVTYHLIDSDPAAVNGVIEHLLTSGWCRCLPEDLPDLWIREILLQRSTGVINELITAFGAKERG